MTYYDDWLQHHGVKGMKWGVRKKRPEPTRLNGSAKVIKKDEVVSRVSRGSNRFNEAGGLYVSLSKEDGERYIKNLGPSFLGQMLKNSGDRVVNIQATKDIKVSSESDFIKNSVKALKKPKNLSELNDSLYSSVYTGDLEKSIKPKHVDAAIKNPKSPEARKLGYVMSSILADPEFTTMSKGIINDLKKAGFDAIPDLHDTMSGTSSTATIILNKDKIKVIGETAITKEHYKRVKKKVKQYGKLPLDMDIQGE